MGFLSVNLARGCYGAIAEIICGPNCDNWSLETTREVFEQLVDHFRTEGYYAITLIFPLSTHQQLIAAAGDVGFKSGGQSYGKGAKWKGFYLLQEERGISRWQKRKGKRRNKRVQPEQRSVSTAN